MVADEGIKRGRHRTFGIVDHNTVRPLVGLVVIKTSAMHSRGCQLSLYLSAIACVTMSVVGGANATHTLLVTGDLLASQHHQRARGGAVDQAIAAERLRAA